MAANNIVGANDNNCDKVGYIAWERMIMVVHLEKAEGGWGRLEPEKVVSFQFGSKLNVS